MKSLRFEKDSAIADLAVQVLWNTIDNHGDMDREEADQQAKELGYRSYISRSNAMQEAFGRLADLIKQGRAIRPRAAVRSYLLEQMEADAGLLPDIDEKWTEQDVRAVKRAVKALLKEAP